MGSTSSWVSCDHSGKLGSSLAGGTVSDSFGAEETELAPCELGILSVVDATNEVMLLVFPAGAATAAVTSTRKYRSLLLNIAKTKNALSCPTDAQQGIFSILYTFPPLTVATSPARMPHNLADSELRSQRASKSTINDKLLLVPSKSSHSAPIQYKSPKA